MLEVDDLHAAYGESWIVQGVSLRVADGQIAAVLGRNGAGKTTLIHAIAGLNPPRRGGLSPAMAWIKVVLPTPLRPSTAATSPSATRSDTPWTIQLSP